MGEPRLTDEEVRTAFRALSDEHIAERRRDDSEATWRLVEKRLEPKRLRVVPPVRVRHAARWGAALAFGACCVALLAFWQLRGRAFDTNAANTAEGANRLTYVVEGGEAPAEESSATVDEKLIATEDRPATISLSDKSRIRLEPHTTLRVHVEGGERVVTRLAQGELSVHVQHHPRTDYRFRAGPYEVRVIGTSFSLSYEPDGQKLALRLLEGRVSVVDGSGQLRFVDAGHSLSLPSPSEAQAEPAALGGDAAAAGDAPRSGASVQAQAPKGADYRSLAAEGRFREIVSAAQTEGVDHVLRTKPAGELQELAQAARYTGELGLAARTWKEMTARFGGKEPGQNASFFLGRLAEQQGRSSEALRHYDTYLAAQSHGVFAPEALGRKMLLVQTTQGEGAARSIAVDYLARFPRGPYASAAGALAAKPLSR